MTSDGCADHDATAAQRQRHTGVNPNPRVNPRVPDGSSRRWRRTRNTRWGRTRTAARIGAGRVLAAGLARNGRGATLRNRPAAATRSRRRRRRRTQLQKGAVDRSRRCDSVPNEVIIEVEGAVTEAQAIALVGPPSSDAGGVAEFSADRRDHVPLADSGRAIGRNRGAAAAGGRRRQVGPAQRTTSRFSRPARRRDDPGQYAIGKLLLAEAHAVTKGDEVRIAVINSGIDVAHPELRRRNRRHLRRAALDRRSAHPRHRHRRRDRRALAPARQRAGVAAARDPRLRRHLERRGEHLVRRAEGSELRGRAERADHQHELCRAEGSAARARARCGRQARHHPDCGRRQRRAEIAAALSRGRSAT